jgi:dienelactone hydrolase
MTNETIAYQDGTLRLEGYAAYPQRSTPAPAVLIAPAWAGRDDFACAKADAIAELGYVGFALDMYGNAKVGKSTEENSALMSPFMHDRQTLIHRMNLALETLRQLKQVDTTRIAAMGFCFGGLCVLDLARSGAEILGVVSFHGILSAPQNTPNKKILAKVLALHGYDDPMGPPEKMLDFANEMTQAGADWQIHAYGNTQHAFTNPQAHDEELGLIYNQLAEKRSWQAMKNFFSEIFVGE